MSIRHNIIHKALSPLRVDIALVVIVALFFLPLFQNMPQRVGDGSEYYGLFLALKNHHLPWMTAGVFSDYGALLTTNKIQGLVPTEILRESFPALRVGNTADFNHFWFYSLPPAIISNVFEIVGMNISIQSAFLALHAGLLFITMRLAYRAQGILGLVVVITLTVCSPIVWFADKVHTEFFTYSLALCTFILVAQRRYVAGSLFMAIAATQNPSFAILCFLLLFLRIISWRINRVKNKEIVVAFVAIFISTLHPLYYLARYGVFTPQLIAGGAKLGGNLAVSYVWFFDPDLGLFPNWPLGLAVALAMVFFVAKSRWGKFLSSEHFFLLSYLTINLFAQSSTTVLNSGATPGLARYALWYIPLFYPAGIFLGSIVRDRASIFLKIVTLSGILTYACVNYYAYDPRRSENYTSPSQFSSFVQTFLPSFYDPPHDVFLKRFSNTGDSPATRSLSAVVGPSCDKVLLIPEQDSKRISIPDHCIVQKSIIVKAVAEAVIASPESRYIRIYGVKGPALLPGSGSYYFADGEIGLSLLGSGWHNAESWGVWSRAPAVLNIPCALSEGSTFTVKVTLRPFITPQQPSMNLRIVNKDDLLFDGLINQNSQEIPLLVSRRFCDSKNRTALTMTANRYQSPKELALSDDARSLGIGLEMIRYAIAKK